MKAITLHKIRVISQKNRSDMSPEIAFLSLWSVLILYAFDKAHPTVGEETAGFCIWAMSALPKGHAWEKDSLYQA